MSNTNQLTVKPFDEEADLTPMLGHIKTEVRMVLVG
jgi:hypothetical protein